MIELHEEEEEKEEEKSRGFELRNNGNEVYIEREFEERDVPVFLYQYKLPLEINLEK